MTNRAAWRKSLSLVEVMVSATVLGVAAVGYASMYNAQQAQGPPIEEWVVAMELVSRQIEYLRAADPTASSCPFASNFQASNLCVPVSYTGEKLPITGRGEPLTDSPRNSFRFSANGPWVIGDNSSGKTPPELLLPRELQAKKYQVEGRAARVRSITPGTDGTSESFFENLLIHYQVTVSKAGRPLLVVPYLRQVQVP
jgi:hypothetical protein